MTFTCCFLNCADLWDVDPEAPDRATGDAALNGKLKGLAQTLRDAARGKAPDLFGLCEIGSEAVAARVATALEPNTYGSVWSDAPRGRAGLAVLYRKALFNPGRSRVDDGGDRARRRWMAVRLEVLAKVPTTMWFVVHHWPSPRSGPNYKVAQGNVWSEFSAFYKSEARIESDAIVVVGDFNCDPGDSPLVNQPDQALVTTRERRVVKRGYRDALYLYNPMWRLMGEEHPHEETLAQGYSPTRELGTWSRSGEPCRMLDQLFVSRALLIGSALRLQEGSLTIARPVDSCSDHSAIGAEFRSLENEDA